MSISIGRLVIALILVAVGLALGAAGLYVGHTDDAPGAGLLGLVLMVGLAVLGIRTARVGAGRGAPRRG